MLAQWHPGSRESTSPDCQSSDGTSDIFARTPPHCQKVVLRTSLPAQGKGAALRLVFEYMLQADAKHGLTLDTDVTSITPDWIKSFSLALAYDFAIFCRTSLCTTLPGWLHHEPADHPGLCAVFGRDVRQAIGGDFGFSRRAAEAFLAQPWSPSIEKHGVNNFVTTTVLKKGFSIGEVELPAKVHSPSLPKLKRMFMEVLEVLLARERPSPRKSRHYLASPCSSMSTRSPSSRRGKQSVVLFFWALELLVPGTFQVDPAVLQHLVEQ